MRPMHRVQRAGHSRASRLQPQLARNSASLSQCVTAVPSLLADQYGMTLRSATSVVSTTCPSGTSLTTRAGGRRPTASWPDRASRNCRRYPSGRCPSLARPRQLPRPAARTPHSCMTLGWEPAVARHQGGCWPQPSLSVSPRPAGQSLTRWPMQVPPRWSLSRLCRLTHRPGPPLSPRQCIRGRPRCWRILPLTVAMMPVASSWSP